MREICVEIGVEIYVKLRLVGVRTCLDGCEHRAVVSRCFRTFCLFQLHSINKASYVNIPTPMTIPNDNPYNKGNESPEKKCLNLTKKPHVLTPPRFS